MDPKMWAMYLPEQVSQNMGPHVRVTISSAVWQSVNLFREGFYNILTLFWCHLQPEKHHFC